MVDINQLHKVAQSFALNEIYIYAVRRFTYPIDSCEYGRTFHCRLLAYDWRSEYKQLLAWSIKVKEVREII